MLGLVTRPLLIIFLTIFVNLVGFGIIIPLLPFYAQTFGASPLTIGLLFAIFSLCQLAAAPALGGFDKWIAFDVLVFVFDFVFGHHQVATGIIGSEWGQNTNAQVEAVQQHVHEHAECKNAGPQGNEIECHGGLILLLSRRAVAPAYRALLARWPASCRP